MMTRTVFFDFETGGLEPHHPDIQIAAVAVEDWKEVEHFERKIQFNLEDCDPEALSSNKYDKGTWAIEAFPEDLVVSQFSAFLKKHAGIKKFGKKPPHRAYWVARVAGHNIASFDFPRLKNLFSERSMFMPADYKVLDTYQLSIWYEEIMGIKFENNRLAGLADHFGISSEGAHDALFDVRMNIRVAHELYKGVVSGNYSRSAGDRQD